MHKALIVALLFMPIHSYGLLAADNSLDNNAKIITDTLTVSEYDKSAKGLSKQLNNTFYPDSLLDYTTSTNAVVWWDKKYDFRDEAENMLVEIENIFQITTSKGMEMPVGYEDTYINFFIYNQDDLENETIQYRCCGVGTDGNGMPFTSFPSNYFPNNPTTDYSMHMTFYHELFHMMQYKAGNFYGTFPYVVGSRWYTESTASWFGRKYGLAGEQYSSSSFYSVWNGQPAVNLQPQVSMWGGGDGWSYGNHRYAMEAFIKYLVDANIVSESFVYQSYYSGTNLTPQEYLYQNIPSLETIYGQFAARYTSGLMYSDVDHEAIKRMTEWWIQYSCDVNVNCNSSTNEPYNNQFVAEINEVGTNGFISPVESNQAWSWTVIKINTEVNASYRLNFQPDESGSEGTPSDFRVYLTNRENSVVQLLSDNEDFSVQPNSDYFVVVVNTPQRLEGSETFDYEISIEALDAPSQVTLLFPNNGSSEISLNPTLQWQALSGVSSYNVQVSNDSFNTTILDESTTSTSISLSGLNYNTTYQWRVRGVGGGANTWSSTWSFITNNEPTQDPPGKPILVFPVNEQDSVDLPVSLKWSVVEETDSYRVQVSNNNFEDVQINEVVTDTTISVTSLSYDSEYSWRVRATNSSGNGDWSSINTFSTRKKPLPNSTTLVYPSDGEVQIPLDTSLIWQNDPLADLSIVELRADNELVRIDTVSTTQLDVDLSYNTVYNWRVLSTNATGNGSWSETWTFTSVQEPVGLITLQSPQDSSLNVSARPKMIWSHDSTATSYELEIHNESTDVTVLESIVDDTVYTPSLEYETDYQWRVRAKNLSGTGEWSQQFSFTTSVEKTSPPVIKSPAQNQDSVEVPTVFTWLSEPSASNYEIQLYTDAFTNEIFSLDVTDTTYTYADMQEQKDYLFRVRANNAAGTSNWSNVEFRTGEKEVGTSTEWGAGAGADADAIPTTYGLEQNYPNPFNPSTVIRYAVPQAGEVQLEVYDMMGRKVSTLVQGTKPAGYHEAVFDASHLGSGAYMYRLMAGDVVLARTLYLIK